MRNLSAATHAAERDLRTVTNPPGVCGAYLHHTQSDLLLSIGIACEVTRIREVSGAERRSRGTKWANTQKGSEAEKRSRGTKWALPEKRPKAENTKRANGLAKTGPNFAENQL